MPFRQKIKKVFGRSTNTSESGSSEGSSSRKDSSVYQPGDPMPVPKYRGFVDPKHKQRLETFSFGPRDWRRQSTNSGYSPRGSKMPSRQNSVHREQNHFGELQDSSSQTEGAALGGDPNTGLVDESKGASEHREFADADAPKPQVAS